MKTILFVLLVGGGAVYFNFLNHTDTQDRISKLETTVHNLKLQVQAMGYIHENFESEVADGWQKHEDDIEFIKYSLGISK